MIFRPCASSIEENEKIWQSSEFYTAANFQTEYRKHIIAMQHVAECAKIFILKNWEAVKDWSKLNIVITDNSGSPTEYYNHVPRERVKRKRNEKMTGIDKLFARMDRDDAKKHNPITEITKVFLDPSDGDFSLTINGKDHLWINNESIILIANYIEEQLKSVENGKA